MARAPGPRRPSRADLLALREGPHEYLRRVAADYGPVARVRVGPFTFHLVTAPDEVQRVLVTNQANYGRDTFQYRLLAEVTGEGLLTTDGDTWHGRRRAEQPSFHREQIAGLRALMTECAEAMVGRWDAATGGGESVDVAAEMMHVALQIVMRALFSADVGDRAAPLARATMDVLHHVMFRARTFGLIPRWLPTPGNRRAARALGVLHEAISGTIARRRAGTESPDDLLARLMRDAAFTDRQLRSEMMTMLIAGHETVASALAWTWHLLGTHPDIDARLHAETSVSPAKGPGPSAGSRPYTAAVFREALRLYPPAWLITRRAHVPDVLGGFAVPAGAVVVLSPYVTQRDPAQWERPDAFEPERFLVEERAGPRYAYFPYGGGPHLCIGSHFAALEAEVVLATVARRFRLEPAGPAPAVDPGVTLQPKGGLTMRLRRR